jgi:hypothetical protein
MKKFAPGLEIVVMARERQQETLRAIDALRSVPFGINVKIVLSDNASIPEKSLRDIPGEIEHRIRIPSGSWNWHFNKIVSELEYEWCLITHDDDEIQPVLGEVFQKYSNNEDVAVITGLSRIVEENKGPIRNIAYENRIDLAELRNPAGFLLTDLSNKLFDLGTLYPASAMIIRSELLQQLAPLDQRYELTADFGLSVEISHNHGVIFEGAQPVMNYNLHKNNSVFTDEAAGGIKPDFTITRILLMDKFNDLYTEQRMTELVKSVIQSRILISAFGLKSRRQLLNKTIRTSQILQRNRIKQTLMNIPINLGPLAPVVRYLMRKRIAL